MEQKTIIALILGILVVISAVQAVQLYSLKEKVNSGAVSTSAGKLSTASTSGKTVTAVPSNVKELPKMVGGC